MSKNIYIGIIGDSFADLFCFLDVNQSLPSLGGDSRLSQPIHVVAGGSALNTATHLQYLLDSFTTKKEEGNVEEEKMTTVELQSVLNEQDEYGKMLLNHVDKFGFQFINCCQQHQNDNSNSCGSISNSTGHCAVIVCNNERSFMTHLGCVENFHASHIDVDRLVLGNPKAITSTSINTHHHVHVAGYYNIPGFWNGALREQLRSVKTRRDEMNPNLTATTTTSLVPQHDATEKWDGQLLNLLHYVDFLIMNELEAVSIVSSHDDGFRNYYNNNDSNSSKDDDTLLHRMATFFQCYNSNMYVIVTRGAKGAVALQSGKLLHAQQASMVENVIDPTGAGDAFAAGFIRGLFLDWKQEEKNEAVKEGLKWGCAVGTGCVLRQGASNPSSKQEIESLLAISSSLSS